MTDRIHPAGSPFTDDDASIAAALEDVSVPTLMMSMVPMTGDASILRGPLRPAGIFLNEVQGFMPEADQAGVRARALDVIRAYRDGGCRLPPPPPPETIHEMIKVKDVAYVRFGAPDLDAIEHFSDGDLLNDEAATWRHEPAVALATQWGRFGSR